MKHPLPLLLLTALVASCSEQEASADTRADLAAVVKGPFPITVTESGEIKAAKSTLVKNEMEGNSTIIDLIEEGSIVKQGDILVELDASSQIERRATQEIAVEKAAAAVINARKNLEILRKQVDSDVRAAKNVWDFAKMDKKKFYGEELPNGAREMGEREQSIIAEEAEIDLARSALKLAEDKYNWSVKLRAKDFITKETLDQDRLDYESKKTKLTLAINKLAILKKYTHIKTQRELDQAEDVARIEYERAVAKGEAEITQAEADLKAKIAEAELASDLLKNLEKQIKGAIVRAPSPGIVVYASEGDRYRRKTIEIGTQVRERQSLIILPDTSQMLAELKIQEVMIDKIRPGLPALIKIDTTNQPRTGIVQRRAPLPDSGSRGMNPDLKVYKTTVAIDGNNEENVLRPNMSATITIIIARLEDVLSVPQTAVFSDRAVNYVWLNNPEGPVATKVKVGPHNETRVVIEEGLTEGQEVYLVEPEGLKPPEFEQPKNGKERELPDVPIPSTLPDPENLNGNGGQPGNRPGNRPGSRRGAGPSNGSAGAAGGMAAFRKVSEDFKAVVKAKDPALHQRIEAAGPRWSRDPEIKSALEANPELATEYADYQRKFGQFMEAMGRGRRSRGDGGDGGGEGRRGRGEGGFGGDGRRSRREGGFGGEGRRGGGGDAGTGRRGGDGAPPQKQGE